MNPPLTAPVRRRRDRVSRSRLGRLVRGVAIVVLVAVVLLPVYLTFASALFPTGEFLRSGLFPSPERLTFDNIATALGAVPFVPQYLTSVTVVILQTAAQLITSVLAAYALVFPRWRLRAAVFGVIIVTLGVPGESLTISNYDLVSSIGLRDTVFGIVLPYLAAGYTIFLLRQAFASFPFEVWEASRLDGCGHLRSLVGVVLPSCRAHLTTAALWSALSAWNGFFWPLLITDSPQNRTIQVGVTQLVAGEIAVPPVVFAGAALVLIPTVLLVIFSQRFLIGGMAAGSLR